MARKFILLITLILFVLSLGAVPAWSNEDEKIAKELTVILRASRAVLVQNKPLIKNPSSAGIDVDKFLQFTYANYEKTTKNKFKISGGNLGKAQGMLVDAIKGVVGDVVSGKDKDLDPKGRFLPAIFARKAATRFGEISGGKMYLKLTTRDDYLVNQSNKADEWEKGVIEDKFMKTDWENGKTFSEVSKHNGNDAFRLILPEYFKAGCMGCHGGDNGAKIHPGKKGGTVGELGGAISVAIYK